MLCMAKLYIIGGFTLDCRKIYNYAQSMVQSWGGGEDSLEMRKLKASPASLGAQKFIFRMYAVDYFCMEH